MTSIQAGPLPNAPRRLGRDWHVSQSQARASDANPGDAARPLRTIARAFALAQPGDRILVGAGVYREEVIMTRNGHHSVPESVLTVEAREGQSVFWKGSDVFSAKWRRRSDGLHEAPLPRALFRKGAYNPYALNGTLGHPGRVRPAKGKRLPETLGQLYIDEHPVHQESGLEAVRQTPDTFVVSADGRSLVVHFTGGMPLVKAMLELTVRRNCLVSPAEQVAMVETRGLVVEHAAEPEPICLGRPVTLRREGAGGLLVRKTRVLPNNIIRCNNIGPISYRNAEGATLIASVQHPDATHNYGEPQPYYTAISDDAGLTWTPMPGTVRQNVTYPSGYFLDAEANRLLRYRAEQSARSKTGCLTVVEISADGGQSWGSPTTLDFGYPVSLIRLADGTLLWSASAEEARWHYGIRTMRGRWRAGGRAIEWREGVRISIAPDVSDVGLDEPAVCQLADGRLAMLLRAGAVLPAQNRPGVPSVKLLSVSEDNGRRWSRPKPLTYEDGTYIYSSRSYPNLFRSIKNGRVYALFNIAPEPTSGCDPRDALHLVELDQRTLRARRQTVTVVDARHPAHHWLVRYSNWYHVQDRRTGNPLVFMMLAMCEWCPIRRGYDLNGYRYEIELPARSAIRRLTDCRRAGGGQASREELRDEP